MKFKDYGHDGTVIFEIHGNVLGGKEMTLFLGRLREYLNLGFKKFIVDLKHVERMNSLGLGMLTSAYNTTKRENTELVLVDVDRIESLLMITRLVKIFKLFDTIDEAKKYFASHMMVKLK